MIRRYDPDDLSELLSVWYDAVQVAHPFWSAEHFEQERRDISEEFLPIAETWVFESEGRVVGFISVMDDEVGGLFVAPQSQRSGIGGALMDHVWATRGYLELDVFEANELGRAFYDAYGFEVVGQRPDQDTGLQVLRLKLRG